MSNIIDKMNRKCVVMRLRYSNNDISDTIMMRLCYSNNSMCVTVIMRLRYSNNDLYVTVNTVCILQ